MVLVPGAKLQTHYRPFHWLCIETYRLLWEVRNRFKYRHTTHIPSNPLGHYTIFTSGEDF